MGNADITLRHISRRHAESLARPYVLEGPFEVVGWSDSQVTAVERRLDKILLLERVDGLHGLEIELEYRYENDLPDRIHEYQGLYRMAYRDEHPDRPPPLLDAVVVLLTGRRRAWPEERVLRTGWRGRDHSRTHFRIDAVYQRGVAELRARGSPFWLAFTPLAPDADRAAMRAVVKEMRARVPRDDERADLFAALLVLAEVDPWGHTLRKEIEAMLRESTFDMMTVSKTLRDAYEAGQREGIEQGLEKGIEQGLEKGIEQGLEKGIEKGVERMLRGLFAKRLHRALTARERRVLAARATSAPDEAQEKVLALEGEALAAWLNGPVPKTPAPSRARRRAASST